MAKLVREIDGVRYVGVVISSDYGAGWSTWNNCDPCDGDFIQYLIDNGKIDDEDDNMWYVDIEQEVVENFLTATINLTAVEHLDLLFTGLKRVSVSVLMNMMEQKVSPIITPVNITPHKIKPQKWGFSLFIFY